MSPKLLLLPCHFCINFKMFSLNRQGDLLSAPPCHLWLTKLEKGITWSVKAARIARDKWSCLRLTSHRRPTTVKKLGKIRGDGRKFLDRFKSYSGSQISSQSLNATYVKKKIVWMLRMIGNLRHCIVPGKRICSAFAHPAGPVVKLIDQLLFLSVEAILWATGNPNEVCTAVSPDWYLAAAGQTIRKLIESTSLSLK